MCTPALSIWYLIDLKRATLVFHTCDVKQILPQIALFSTQEHFREHFKIFIISKNAKNVTLCGILDTC